MANFTYESAQEGNVLIFRTNGYLDQKAGLEFAAYVRSTLAPEQNRVVFNFTGSPIINSSGMASFVELTSLLLDEREGKVGVCGISNLAKATMNAIGLFSMITEFADEAAAVAALKKSV